MASIRTITDLRRLDEEALAKGWPVRLRALVTFVDTPRRLFARTAGGGVEVKASVNFDTTPGAWILVTGHALNGAHGPVISVKTVEPADPPQTAAGLRLPNPTKINQGGVIGKRYQSQWVSGDGNVRRIESTTNGLQLVLARSGLRFTALIRKPGEAEAMVDLLGKRVVVTGVGDMDEGLDRRPTVNVLVPSPDGMNVSGESLDDLADAPPVLITNLFHIAAGPLARARRIEGVVTYREEHRLFLADDSGSISVLSEQAADVHVGDVVSAIGYPVAGDDHRFLEDALLQSRGQGQSAKPQMLSASRAFLWQSRWGTGHGGRSPCRSDAK